MWKWTHILYNAWKLERLCHKGHRIQLYTYIDLLPLADISDQPRQSEEPDQREEFGQPQDTQGSACVKNLETVAEILEQYF